jgi:hypoxanthine phosphoribosyltransferase
MKPTVKYRIITPKYKVKPGDILISPSQIQDRIKEIAPQMVKRFKGKNLLIIGVLKGALLIMTDLGRELYKAGLTDVTLDFMRVESYGAGAESTGELKIIHDITTDPHKRNILIIDDINDTNLTLTGIIQHFKKRGAASISTFVLLEKPARHKVSFQPDFVGFQIPNVFVGGYGLDFDQYDRFNSNILVGPIKHRGNK